jgi:hypothetical protein
MIIIWQKTMESNVSVCSIVSFIIVEFSQQKIEIKPVGSEK